MSISSRKEVQRSPVIVTGTAGSGTRVFCDLIEALGCSMGPRQNRQKDNLDFIELVKDGIPLGDPAIPAEDNYLWYFDLNSFDIESLPGVMIKKTRDRLSGFRDIITPGTGDGTTLWGWKESQSLFVLPFLHELFPDMSLVHIVRDGRDIAFSGQQKARYQAHYVRLINKRMNLAVGDDEWPIHVACTWQIVNTGAKKWALKNMDPARYIVLKLEELENDLPKSVGKLQDFLHTRKKPDTVQDRTAFDSGKLRLRKYAGRPAGLVKRIEREVEDGLGFFGYL